MEHGIYDGENAEIPRMIELDSDGSTLLLDGEPIGQFAMTETTEGSTRRTWELLLEEDPDASIVLTMRSNSLDNIILEYRIDASTPEYYSYVTLWSVRLAPIPKVRFELESDRGTSSLYMDWYSTNLIPENAQALNAAALEGRVKASIVLEDDSVTELTVLEEYHHNGQVSTREYHLTKDKNGVFPLPEELSPRYNGEGQFAIYSIAWGSGEYLFRLDFE